MCLCDHILSYTVRVLIKFHHITFWSARGLVVSALRPQLRFDSRRRLCSSYSVTTSRKAMANASSKLYCSILSLRSC